MNKWQVYFSTPATSVEELGLSENWQVLRLIAKGTLQANRVGDESFRISASAIERPH